MNNMPVVTKNLLIVNFLAFIATWVLQLRGIDLTSLLGLHFFLASDFHVYQFVTYMFLHGGLTHIFFNMFALWMFGSVIERVWGPKKFLFYYIVCGIGAGFVQEIVQYANYMVEDIAAYQYVNAGGVQLSTDAYINLWTTIGASGAVYAILLAFGMIFPNERLFIIPFPFPIKAKWLVIGYIAIELFSAMSAPGDGVAHMAHLGGMLFGFLLIRYWQKHPDSSQHFGRNRGQEFFDNMKRRYEQRQQQSHMKAEHTNSRFESDEEYNARKHKNQEEIDAILDKIRKSGYDSLTKEEKQKLFDQSRES
ncbi:MAG: rhomboid family intramembrane serine protease [Prevotella sp.]|nr:rhomboid family intramembrane serine protease [Prevotella sp.]MBR3078669.1 rhomboid family intramembrane serine protease [Prevotella sp.]